MTSLRTRSRSVSDRQLHIALALKCILAKRAVTKKCPVCEEDIPVRLLERHADLEVERLDEIMAAIGSIEVLDIAEPDDG